MVVLLIALVGVAWWQGGSELAKEGLGAGGQMLLRFSLLIVVAFLVAGLAERLIPHEWVRGALGEEAGMRGLLIAAVAGAITPSGPFLSMPIAAALLRSGAGSAAVVVYLSSWALLAVHRFVAWEVPILGFQFAALRWIACAALPVLAGLAVRVFAR
jgi:uncharacterized membrane protein YraQ (UPF0718 family)